MADKQVLQSMLDCINEDTQVRLFLITRHIKSDLRRSARILDKYDFRANQIDVVSSIQDYFREIIKEQLKTVISDDDRAMMKYDIICDDLDAIYTYALNNALSFSAVISEQLSSARELPSVSSLKEVENDLWGYCWKITENSQTFYSFRKSSKGKVSTDKNSGVNKITAWFDSSNSELKKFVDDTISFDDKIDCVYMNEQFYVFHKNSFEALLGLEDEFKANAEVVLETIEQTEQVEGLDALKEQILESKSILKTLASIAKKKTHEGLSSEEVRKMSDVLKRMENRDLKLSDNGKIKLDNMKDLQDFVKLLNDFYKQGLVTGNYYGTNSGRKIDV